MLSTSVTVIYFILTITFMSSVWSDIINVKEKLKVIDKKLSK
jgi:hypothetical protein